jgi:hypothetical protein
MWQDGRTIIKWVFKKWDEETWTGSKVKVCIVVIMMMMMMMNFQPAEWLLASQGVCSMRVVISTNTEIQLHSTSQLIKFVHQECGICFIQIFDIPH